MWEAEGGSEKQTWQIIDWLIYIMIYPVFRYSIRMIFHQYSLQKVAYYYKRKEIRENGKIQMEDQSDFLNLIILL